VSHRYQPHLRSFGREARLTPQHLGEVQVVFLGVPLPRGQHSRSRVCRQRAETCDERGRSAPSNVPSMSNSMPGVDVLETELFTAMMLLVLRMTAGYVYKGRGYGQGELRFSVRYQQEDPLGIFG